MHKPDHSTPKPGKNKGPMQDNNGETNEKLPASGQTEGSVPYERLHFIDTTKPVWNYSLLSDEDVANFQQGTYYRIYEKFGSHSIRVLDTWGMYFCVWAPNATAVSVIGNFNNW